MRVCLLALTCSVGQASLAIADYQESYRRGILAIEAKKYQEAIRALRQAADENPLEGGDPVADCRVAHRARTCRSTTSASAYFRMGDCGRAGITWQMAKMGGEVLDHPQLARAMKDATGACESGKAGGTKLAEAGPTPAAPAAPAVPSASAATSPRVKNLLEGARSDLTAKRFARARQRAEEALGLGADQAQVDALLADVHDAESAAAAAMPSATAPVAGAAPPAAPTAAATGEAERQAMEAFFALDYSRAQRLLEPLAGQSALTPRGYLYLACSYAAEAVLTGRDVDAQVRRARGTYQKAQPGGSKFDADWK